MKKRLFLGASAGVLAVAVVLIVVFTGVLSSSSGTTFTTSLTGASEVPPINTLAQGEAVFVLSPDGNSLIYKVTVSNISDVAASHIHLAASGVNGPVAAGLFSGIKAGRFDGILAEGTITAANLSGPLAGMSMERLATEMKAGNTYVNVHTSAHPSGEIRGQIGLSTN